LETNHLNVVENYFATAFFPIPKKTRFNRASRVRREGPNIFFAGKFRVEKDRGKARRGGAQSWPFPWEHDTHRCFFEGQKGDRTSAHFGAAGFPMAIEADGSIREVLPQGGEPRANGPVLRSLTLP
jgi:hypothetical protein